MSRLMGGLIAVAGVLLVGLILVPKPWSPSAERQTDVVAGEPRSDFAADRDPTPAEPVAFNAKRAMGYLEDLCKIGPRISGTEGMQKQQDLLKKHFEAHGGKVEFQRFKARQISQRQQVDMANLIVSWQPERQRRLILCSHYDTRPIADQEPDERNWRKPFISANDGGSGVALLMELAHHMNDMKTMVGVDFVFFDGEEFIHDKGDRYFFGSDYFANAYRKNRPKYVYLGAVLLDMVGGKDARFPIEPNSALAAGRLVDHIWAIAAERNCTAFQNQRGKQAVEDDHIALNRAGIFAIDIIDFNYQHWHRLSDLPENCSGESLEQVAQVLAIWLQRVK